MCTMRSVISLLHVESCAEMGDQIETYTQKTVQIFHK